MAAIYTVLWHLCENARKEIITTLENLSLPSPFLLLPPRVPLSREFIFIVGWLRAYALVHRSSVEFFTLNVSECQRCLVAVNYGTLARRRYREGKKKKKKKWVSRLSVSRAEISPLLKHFVETAVTKRIAQEEFSVNIERRFIYRIVVFMKNLETRRYGEQAAGNLVKE